MKKCTKCGVEYPKTNEYFHCRNRNSKIGLYPSCKKCKNAERDKWKKINIEKVKEYQKKYRIENDIKVKELNKKYTIENNDKIKEYQKKWYAENNVIAKNARIKWNVEHPEKCEYSSQKHRLKKQIGETPPPELVEIKVLINKTKRLCKTSKNLETI
jgi:hypothetical protein